MGIFLISIMVLEDSIYFSNLLLLFSISLCKKLHLQQS